MIKKKKSNWELNNSCFRMRTVAPFVLWNGCCLGILAFVSWSFRAKAEVRLHEKAQIRNHKSSLPPTNLSACRKGFVRALNQLWSESDTYSLRLLSMYSVCMPRLFRLGSRKSDDGSVWNTRGNNLLLINPGSLWHDSHPEFDPDIDLYLNNSVYLFPFFKITRQTIGL